MWRKKIWNFPKQWHRRVLFILSPMAELLADESWVFVCLLWKKAKRRWKTDNPIATRQSHTSAPEENLKKTQFSQMWEKKENRFPLFSIRLEFLESTRKSKERKIYTKYRKIKAADMHKRVWNRLVVALTPVGAKEPWDALRPYRKLISDNPNNN